MLWSWNHRKSGDHLQNYWVIVVVPLKSYSATATQLFWETVLPGVIPALLDSELGFELKSATSVSSADSDKLLNCLVECPVQQFIIFFLGKLICHSTSHRIISTFTMRMFTRDQQRASTGWQHSRNKKGFWKFNHSILVLYWTFVFFSDMSSLWKHAFSSVVCYKGAHYLFFKAWDLLWSLRDPDTGAGTGVRPRVRHNDWGQGLQSNRRTGVVGLFSYHFSMYCQNWDCAASVSK